MPDKDRKSPLPEPPKNPLEFIQDLDSAIKNADDALRSVDKNLRNFDDQLNSTPKELATKRMRRERGRPKTEAREPTGRATKLAIDVALNISGKFKVLSTTPREGNPAPRSTSRK